MADTKIGIARGCGERGERGERGKRGRRGPGGPATSLVSPTEGPGTLIADQDIPAGFVFSNMGSARLAMAVDYKGNRVPTGIPPSLDPRIIYVCPDPGSNPDDCPSDLPEIPEGCHECTPDELKDCLIDPETDLFVCPWPPAGVASDPTPQGSIVHGVVKGPLELSTATWDASTGESGGLIPQAIYYLSQTAPGRLTKVRPESGQIIMIGTALTPTVLDVNIESGQTDGLTLVGRGTQITGPFSAVGYGFASGYDFEGFNGAAWQLAPAALLAGTPIAKNLIDDPDVIGQQPAFAGAWLSSHVIGLSTPGSGSLRGIAQGKFVSGGLFVMSEDQWNAVWTAADPNRGSGSGLLPGYPYYLSDRPGTSFLIDKTGVPPVAPGSWITKCFFALSSTYALIQIGDPRQLSTTAPTTESVTTVANLAVADPNVDVTFITEGGDADGRQEISLANGSIDGFEKTIMWPQGAIPVIGYRVTPASGPVVDFNDTPGAVTFRWKATAGAWIVQSTLNSV